jgi:hypothetical protein
VASRIGSRIGSSDVSGARPRTTGRSSKRVDPLEVLLLPITMRTIHYWRLGLGGVSSKRFLDGFAPALNPEIWRDEVLQGVAARSAPGARAATFTVAGQVRRGLSAAGFEVRRAPGHGRKRERLEAILPGEGRDPAGPGGVAVVGAGIAGASVVQALRRQEVRHLELVDAAARGLAAGQEGLAAELGQLRHEVGELDEVPLRARQHHLAAVLAHRLEHVLGVAGVARRRRLHLHVAEGEGGGDGGGVGTDHAATAVARDGLGYGRASLSGVGDVADDSTGRDAEGACTCLDGARRVGSPDREHGCNAETGQFDGAGGPDSA